MNEGELRTAMAKNNIAIEREAKIRYIDETLDELSDKEIEDLAEMVHVYMARKV